MSNEAEQSDQRRANLAALRCPGRRRPPPSVRGDRYRVGAGRAPHRDPGGGPRSGARPHGGRRAGAGHPQLRQGRLPGAVRRALAPPNLPAPGRPVRSRLRGLAAARSRRPRRRRRAPVPHQDRRVVGVGLVAHLPRQVLPAAAGEVARPERRRDPLPAALPGSGGEPRRPTGLRGAQPHRGRGARVPDRPRLPRSRDADDAADRRRRPGPALRHAPQRARSPALPAHRARALPQAAGRSAASTGSSRSTATSATRGSRPSTTPSSRCSSSIGPTWTTRR